VVKIIWSPQSLEDIDNIAHYIAKDSLKYAQIQVADFFESATILELYPKAGRIVPEHNKPDIRELIVGFYRLIYRISSTQQIDVLTIHHSRKQLISKNVRGKRER
jgi:toxin ParE1/3/4